MKKYYLPVTLFVFALALSYFWFNLNNPKQPMYVEVLNDTETIFPSVIIEHGGNGIQEKIILTQFKPQEVRIVALNHKPGMGFNIAVNYANGEKTEICGGKSKDHWFIRETITKFGIYDTPIR